MDYVSEHDAPEVAELLRANGALTGAEILAQTAEETVPLGETDVAKADQSDAMEASPGVADEETDREKQTEAGNFVLPVRPPSAPPKQSLEMVVFESEEFLEMGEGGLGDSRDSALAPRRPSAKSLDIQHVSLSPPTCSWVTGELKAAFGE